VWLFRAAPSGGTGDFTDTAQQLGNHDSYGEAVGDLDGDGDLDAFVANIFHGDRVWLNDNLPVITEVLVRGSGWTQPFLDELENLSLGTDGYSIPVGSIDQLDALPWSNIDQVLIRFNKQVNVDVTGLTTGIGATGDFEAVWTLTADVATNKLRTRLDGAAGGAVTDTAGRVLDGEWTDTVSIYPSGDDVAGGDFAFRFNVLPADSNGDGFVTLNPDVQAHLNGLGSSIVGSGYAVFTDYNGDGLITLNPDTQTVLNNLGTSLPAGDPAGPGVVTAGGSAPSAATAVAPSARAVTKLNTTTSALERVIAIPTGRHAMPRYLDVTGFDRARIAGQARSDNVTGVVHAEMINAHRILDVSESDSEDSIDLLAQVGPIF